jgi:RNase H-fold protein (predicted Holliday junction resolvase)
MGKQQQILYHQVVPSADAIAILQQLCQQFSIATVVMGDQTTAKKWKQKLERELSASLPIVLVDERYSSLEARDLYWQMYPPTGLQRLIPQGMREPPRPIDDIVAILLIERYLKGLEMESKEG